MVRLQRAYPAAVAHPGSDGGCPLRRRTRARKGVTLPRAMRVPFLLPLHKGVHGGQRDSQLPHLHPLPLRRVLPPGWCRVPPPGTGAPRPSLAGAKTLRAAQQQWGSQSTAQRSTAARPRGGFAVGSAHPRVAVANLRGAGADARDTMGTAGPTYASRGAPPLPPPKFRQDFRRSSSSFRSRSMDSWPYLLFLLCNEE